MTGRPPSPLARLARLAGAITLCLGLAGGLVDPGSAQTVPATDAPVTEAPATEAPATPASPATPGADGATGPARGVGLPKSAVVATGGTSRSGKSISILPKDPNAPDYAAWERLASRGEGALGDRRTSNQGLELLRSQLVDWRAALLGARNTNSTRITTLRTQIQSLGPIPAEGVTEAPEIAGRRKTLTDQLVRLQAPGIAADEAYSRADGLIREIDRVLRDRQADELLKLWPSPLNPKNWALAAKGITTASIALWDETRGVAAGPRAGRELRDNLPLIVALLVGAMILFWRGRRWMEGLLGWLAGHAPPKARRVMALIVSLGRIVVPVAAVATLSEALQLSGLLGAKGNDIARTLPELALVVFSAAWLGWRLFPVDDGPAMLRLPAERRAEGRVHTTLLGVMLALQSLRTLVYPAAEVGDAATSILSLPVLVIAGVLLVRLGALLRLHMRQEAEGAEGPTYRSRLVGFVGRAVIAVGVIGPALAVVGYVSAAGAMVYPAALSLGLLSVLFILQQAVADVHAAVFRDESQRQLALLPVLVNFALTLAALPLFALIWGTRPDDLSELWTRFREGFQLGETRVSPTDFLYFALLFGLGFMLTRLFQGALKTTILPKTRLDQGGQNAIVAGTGYIGIFLAALIAINAVGIDLSGLAIVAGALSVGIGFGLQNIVSNFVSGIILLIERPVSEGDWIEVGTVSGTVRAISVRSTRIQTFDRSDVIVPNADLVSQRVTNWTRFNLTGRLIVPVPVIHGSDVALVDRLLHEIAEAQPLTILNPPPIVALMGFTMDALTFELRLILRDVTFSVNVRSEINRQILKRFAEAGVILAHAPSPLAPPKPEPQSGPQSDPGAPASAPVPPTGTAPPTPKPRKPDPRDALEPAIPRRPGAEEPTL